MPTSPVVLFDGVCNLCNKSVDFIIRHDRLGKIKLGAQQSEAGRKILEKFRLTESATSIVFVEKNQIWIESTAVLMIAKNLDGAWKTAIILLFIPPFLRDALYRLVARNRYKWFGKRDTCHVPTPELKNRFL